MENTKAECIYDLCIVGAGMFGSAAAKYASVDPSLKVCLIGPAEPTTAEERLQRDIFAAHYDEGRITRELDEEPACQILAKKSMEKYSELQEKSGIQFYTTVGCIFMGTKGGEFMTKLTEAGKIGNVSFTNFTDEHSLKQRHPFLNMTDAEYALLDENGAGYISPRKLVLAQKKVAESQGCDIIESEVIQLTSQSIHEVRTASMKTIKAKRILIATGAFTDLKRFDALKPVVLERRKRTIVLLKLPEDEAKRLRTMPSIIRRVEDENSSPNMIGAYILPPIQYPDGKYYLKFGKIGNSNGDIVNSLEEMKQWYLSDGDPDILKTHVDFVIDLISDLKFTNASTVSCATCYSPSGIPYIDNVSPTVTVAFAGNGKGAKMSDEVGRIAAKLSITGKWDSEIAREKFKVVFKQPQKKLSENLS